MTSRYIPTEFEAAGRGRMTLIELEDCRGEKALFERDDWDLTHLNPVTECARHLVDRPTAAAEAEI